MDATDRCCTCHELRRLSDSNVRKTAKDGLPADVRASSAARAAERLVTVLRRS